MGNNYVQISYAGKEYVGQIYEIKSEWGDIPNLHKINITRKLIKYEVTMLEKDTHCIIGNIFIRSIDEIKPYLEDNNEQ